MLAFLLSRRYRPAQSTALPLSAALWAFSQRGVAELLDTCDEVDQRLEAQHQARIQHKQAAATFIAEDFAQADRRFRQASARAALGQMDELRRQHHNARREVLLTA